MAGPWSVLNRRVCIRRVLAGHVLGELLEGAVAARANTVANACVHLPQARADGLARALADGQLVGVGRATLTFLLKARTFLVELPGKLLGAVFVSLTREPLGVPGRAEEALAVATPTLGEGICYAE